MDSSYRSIFKATSIFGGVQVIQIFVTLIKGKFVAVLLGSVGMGITTLLTSPLNMIITLSGLGLATSAVRNISQAYGQNDLSKLSRILKIFRICLICSCFLGTIIVCLFSPFLSQYSFGNKDYTISFILLSLMLIPTLLNQGNTAILQGTRQLKYTAQLSLWGAFVGVLLSIPLYYFFGIKGIVPALIIPTWITYFISLYYTRKIKLPTVVVPKKEVVTIGVDMVKLGFIMVLSVLLGQVTVYILNAFISKIGSVSDVGYMSAAIGMTTMSVSMVFSAMSADYFPRLSAICNDKLAMNETVNRQGEVLLLIATPLLLVFSIFSPLIITILLSKEFQVINDFIRILAFGMVFKSASYAIGYISFAKGDKKTFFLFEAVWGNFINLIFNLLGYTFWGLKGLAFSFVIAYTTYYILVSLLAHYKYGYKYSVSYKKVLLILISISTLLLFVVLFSNGIYIYILGGILTILTCIFSFKELDKRIELVKAIKNFRDGRRK